MMLDFIKNTPSGYIASSLSENDVNYINNYWVSEDGFFNYWSTIIGSCFHDDGVGVKVSQAKQWHAALGGVIFEEEEFELFKEAAKTGGAQQFCVVEEIGGLNWSRYLGAKFFRFNFPVEIEWEEMTRSSVVAADVFLRPVRRFFVVVDNGLMGKYVNNDDEVPYEIIFHR